MSIVVRLYGLKRLLRLRPHGQLLNDLHREAAERVKTYILPHKFGAALYRRYPNAKRRTARYLKWKKRLFDRGLIASAGTNRLSGNLEREATVNARVTATQTRGRVYLKTGQGRFVTGPRRGQTYTRSLNDWQRREIEELSDQDVKELSEWVRYWYVHAALDPRYDAVRLREAVELV